MKYKLIEKPEVKSEELISIHEGDFLRIKNDWLDEFDVFMGMLGNKKLIMMCFDKNGFNRFRDTIFEKDCLHNKTIAELEKILNVQIIKYVPYDEIEVTVTIPKYGRE